ncbi:DUF4255 domain-containing protein [Spirulina major CS-329]|uniref:DUF4255 domain-containing protein n=1 Tax=Spirulina TaxID=1154 RepID=UPI0023304D24|nr:MULTISPECIES: DUF4255 domain-containing protein [Spirulina]MDB9494546.1 DUF4255 domain-containing protein [Spirulina subsalsa CS-330]MDB9502947.1 DUF4255 domain-containing protein [Spirulina major CS-329]
MSNHLAIATVTATLQRIIQSTIQADVSGARVTTLRPDSIGTATPTTGVNIFLYHVPVNYMWGNSAEIQRRNRRGEGAVRSRTAVDMHYMISCYGNDAELEPQRLLGSVIRTLTDYAIISRDLIHDTLEDANLEYLSNSDLSEQFAEIAFAPLNLTLDELSKVWSVFFQTPYCLSVAYKATVAMIEGEATGEAPLPVSDRQYGGTSPLAGQPQITEVISDRGRFYPIETHSTLRIRGQHLNGPDPFIRIGAIEAAPTELSTDQLLLNLATLPTDQLRAGIQSLQLVYRQGKADRGKPAPRVESNTAPFVLRPTLDRLEIGSLTGTPRRGRNGTITAQSNLPMLPEQRVTLSLHEWSTNDPATYLFEASARDAIATVVNIPIKNVKPGDYLVRLHVDGAESCLEVDQDPESDTYGWYVGPRLLIV